MAPRFIVGYFNSIFCFDNDDGFIHQSSIRFNAFPMILLIATMLRLALNLASTRLILQMVTPVPTLQVKSFKPSDNL